VFSGKLSCPVKGTVSNFKNSDGTSFGWKSGAYERQQARARKKLASRGRAGLSGHRSRNGACYNFVKFLLQYLEVNYALYFLPRGA
jgi:hypothetical protein